MLTSSSIPPPAVVGSGRTSVRCSSFSASVWITGFTCVNSCEDYPENTGLGFAKYEEATKTVPSVARSCAFRRRRQLPFRLVVPISEWRLPSTTPFVLDSDYKGIVTMNGISYDVPWGAERPLARESYTRSVPSAPVFDAQSTSSDVNNRLSIPFVTPFSHCSVCDVDEAFPFFYGNLESQVKLVSVKPVFMKYAVDRMHERRQVFLEVVALLDHLFCHLNMPAHVAKRVIPPVVTSNPSPSYIRSVANGDLGAMASPLHPEARSSDVDAKYSCPP